MTNSVLIPGVIEASLRQHLFQNDLEQGAFLLASSRVERAALEMVIEDVYLVPSEGWDVQLDIYLELRNEERAKVMQMARARGLSIVESHSHPHSRSKVKFSASDVKGITEFAKYAQWKLDNRPFAALVWGESSVDGVLWHDAFDRAQRLDSVKVLGQKERLFKPTQSWPADRTRRGNP